MTADVAILASAMTLDEKAALTAGADNWSTFAVPRLGVPGLVLTDGPVGARGATADHESLTTSVASRAGRHSARASTPCSSRA